MFRHIRLSAILALGATFLLPGCYYGAHADTVVPADTPINAVLALFIGQPWAIYVVLAAAALPWIAAIVPPAPPGSGWAPLRKLLDVLAGNVGNAANAALRTPLLEAHLGFAQPIPQAIFEAEHVAQAVLAGVQVGKAQAVAAAAVSAPIATPPAPAPSPAPAVAAAMALMLVAGTLAGCGAKPGQPTLLSQPPTTPEAVANDAQAAVFALEGAYTVVANGELTAAKLLSPGQIAAMKQADATAYKWVVTLRTEAQQANVIAADLVAGQKALADLTALVKGAH